MSRPYYAHTKSNSDGAPLPPTQWEPLDLHLNEVAELAEEFASKFAAGDWGRLAGLWHDLGKYSYAYQDYLLRENGFEAHLESQSRVNHSSAGAQHAAQVLKLGGMERLLAYVIAGHHAGLADAHGGQSSLSERLKKIESIEGVPPELINADTKLSIPSLLIDLKDESRAAFQLGLFTRMLFSCLVDADFLSTERFMNPAQAAERPRKQHALVTLQDVLDRDLEERNRNCEPTAVNRRRAEILAACRNASDLPPGLFSLTVPTGGGKTLASLAFALRHAAVHGQCRVIYAIPFTSIIEQTADAFRCVFHSLGDTVLLEHHSNFDPQRETVKSRLTAQNWDAPLVVTTNVQFFESLFAARTSRCRKLHNIVKSVIILDEAQTLPIELLKPCLAVLRELAAEYGCSIVLCTATQPSLQERDRFQIGLADVREIIPQPLALYEQMRRVRVVNLGTLTDEALIDRLDEHESFLAIVNTRPHALKLYQSLKEQTADRDGLFHLSTLMCGEHRSRVLTKIRELLKNGRPTRVVSTQLVEAGVDVDFPVVYRALSGLDSIAQAAGRCNREGRQDVGDVFVFAAADVKLRGYLNQVASTAGEVSLQHDDLLSPQAIEHYFHLHYWKQGNEHRWDKPAVMDCFPRPLRKFAFDFRTAADRFRMIEDASQSVFVPFEKRGEELIAQLSADGPTSGLLRQLQRYTVNVFEQTYNELIRAGDVEETLEGGYAVLMNTNLYDDALGLLIDEPGYWEPASLIT